MDLIKQNKTLTWLVVSLIVVNIAIVSFMWFNRPGETLLPPPPPPKHRAPSDMVKFLRNELNLNKNQVEKFNELREQHFTTIDSLGKAMHSIKKQLMDNVFLDEKINADSLAEQIGILQAEIEIETYDHFIELKEVCGKEQAEKLKKILHGFFLDREVKRPPLGDPPPPPK
jgi:protein CpxP